MNPALEPRIAIRPRQDQAPRAGAPAPILDRPVFERLLFAQCWEDPRLDEQALVVEPGQTVLCVTSGGCNALALALLGPARVIAIDLNAAQSALLELKVAGARSLSHREYLELLGAWPSTRRTALYRRARGGLTGPARGYWDRNQVALDSGVLRAGRYERYLGAFRRFLLRLHGKERVERLFDLEGLDAQRRFYEEEWDTAAWRLFFRIFFSRTVLGWSGLDRSFFTYVEGIDDFGAHFLQRAKHALTEIPVRENYFLAQICLGHYRDLHAVPAYLREENFEALRHAAGRIEIVTEELGSFLERQPEDTIDRFNYSNVFEWVPQETFERMLRQTHRVARKGARLCYRNLLVRRRHPDALGAMFEAEDALAERLLREDRSFVYSHFEIARVRARTERETRP